MKRTLKRESKVLEIVRREAIGAGGSLSGPGLLSGVCPCREGPRDGERVRFIARAPPSRVRPDGRPCIQSGRRASIGSVQRVVDGCWGQQQ